MSDPSRARSGTFPARSMAEGQRPQGFGRGNPLAHARRPYSPYEEGPGAGGWRLKNRNFFWPRRGDGHRRGSAGWSLRESAQVKVR